MKTISDFSAYVCRLGTLIRQALARIDATEQLFQVVVAEDGRLLGTITDGDIRRAMLGGVSLDDRAERCMHRDPVTGRVGEAESNRARLRALGSSRPFLPVLDDDGRVVEVLVRHLRDAGIGQALVMAGGFGRRLGERTRSTAKPLLPVGGRPMLDHILERLETVGVGQVYISVHYLGDQIRAFVDTRSNRVPVAFIEEDRPLGTAGALGRLDGLVEGPVLVMNGDVLTHADLAAVHDFHLRHGLDGTVGVARHDVDVPFGVVRYDEHGLFEAIEEKPRISNFIAAGLYYLGPEFAGLVPQDGAIDMPELLSLGRRVGLRIGLFPIHEYWRDIGRQEDLEAARSEFASDTDGKASALPDV